VSPPTVTDALWLWLAVAGLALFHGINPAMGWLFAVALALNRHSERILWLALLPIGLGHALAEAVVLFAVVSLGLIVEPTLLRPLAAVILFAGRPGMPSMDVATRCVSACRSVSAVYSCGHF